MHVFKCNVSLICSVTFLEDQFFNFILWQIFAYAVVRSRHKDNLIRDFKKDHVLVQNIYFGFILHHVETQSRAVVTGLAAFSPVTPPPSPPPADVTVRSETCKVNMNLLFLHCLLNFTLHYSLYMGHLWLRDRASLSLSDGRWFDSPDLHVKVNPKTGTDEKPYMEANAISECMYELLGVTLDKSFC